MNLILISIKSIYKHKDDFFFKTDNRQTNHLKNILKVKVNQTVKVGVINKGKGEGVIIEENKNFYVIKLLTPIHLEKAEDNFIPVDIAICIPRPKVLSKSLQQLSSVGVKRIIIVFSEYSNKSYESSKILKNEEIKYALQLGLEQAMCTQFPEIYIHYSFSSFFMNIQKYSIKNIIK
ncbi:RNA methyltransferase, putative [Plasmodium malariae]|uniref:16S rRNA (uracil(1498)-N(3))-methyltransferase n=1 Tax=Plasmodium malariae TaxID=5858 RepID=A0A1C3KZK2_PLAMA|nr:RNA methyltransferase, putative [Plasmodium malariae]